MKINDQIIQIVKKLKLPKGEYAVFGSALLDVYGFRESADIDLVVTKKLFDKLRKNKNWQLKDFPDDGQKLEQGKIEVFYQWTSMPGFDPEGVTERIARAIEIDGVAFINIQDTIEWKVLSGREKDLKDVGFLRGLLEKEGDQI